MYAIKFTKKFIYILCAMVLSSAIMFIVPQKTFASGIAASELNSLTNQQRASVGLGALSMNSQLASAAYAKANDMLADNYWAHVAPDGASPWTFIMASGYDYITAGENLAKGFSTSSGVITAWMNSSSHRANLLNSTYKEAGYAVVGGTLLGETTTLVVAMYGSRSEPAPVAAVPTTNTTTPAPTTTTSTTNTAQTPTTTQTQTITTSSGTQTAADSPTTSTSKNASNTGSPGKTKKVLKSGAVAGAATTKVSVDAAARDFAPIFILVTSIVALLITMRRNLSKTISAKGRAGLYRSTALVAVFALMVVMSLTSTFFV